MWLQRQRLQQYQYIAHVRIIRHNAVVSGKCLCALLFSMPQVQLPFMDIPFFFASLGLGPPQAPFTFCPPPPHCPCIVNSSPCFLGETTQVGRVLREN